MPAPHSDSEKNSRSKSFSLLTILLGILLPVVIFNLIHVFGPRILLGDDLSRYAHSIDNVFTKYYWTEYCMLNDFTEGPAAWVTSNLSPYLVRLFYLLVFLLGISFGAYWVSVRIFNLPRSVSYLAAVMPAILPMQYHIIAGINMSYTLYGTFLAVIAIPAGYHYLTNKVFSPALLALAVVLYALATRLMDQGLFLVAPVGFLFLVCTNRWKRKIPLLGFMGIAAGFTLWRMIFYPRSVGVYEGVQWSDVFQRTEFFLKYLSPFGKSIPSLAVTTFFLIMGVFAIYNWQPLRAKLESPIHFSWIPRKYRVHLFFLFVVIWTVATALPFITVAHWVERRMFHIAGYGPWFIGACGILYCVIEVCHRLRIPNKRAVLVLVIVIVVSFEGFLHARIAYRQYHGGNYCWNALSKLITYEHIPHGSNIVITNVNPGTYASVHTGKGYLARLLGNRTDAHGFVGGEFFFYDPFAQKNLYENTHTGLRSIDNLHLFRFDKAMWGKFHDQRGLVQLQYFLRVISEDSPPDAETKTGDWFLYKIETGKTVIMHQGHGVDNYKKLLKELEGQGLQPDQIMWGDPSHPYGINSPMLE